MRRRHCAGAFPAKPVVYCDEGDCRGAEFTEDDLTVATAALDIVDGLDTLTGLNDNRRRAAAVLAAVAIAQTEAEQR